MIIFEANHGNDTYIYSANIDTLSFTNIDFSAMTLTKDNNDLIITSNEGADSLRIKDAYSGGIKNLNFIIKDSTNTSKDFAQLTNEKAITINGTNGNDILETDQTGTFELKGGSGNDTYIVDNINSTVKIEDDLGSNQIKITNTSKDDCHIVLFVDKNGNIQSDNKTITITTSTGMTGIEANNYNTISKITVKDGYYIGTSEINELKENIASWLDGKAESVQEIIESENATLIEELLGICNNINWKTDTPPAV